MNRICALGLGSALRKNRFSTVIRRFSASTVAFRSKETRYLITERRFSTESSEDASEALRYARKSPTEHVLLRPDTYIGGVAVRENENFWVYDADKRRMVNRTVTYAPGLLKIFDEILVNAADNKARDPKGMTEIRVDIDRENGRISVWNNGRGLPVQIHPTEGVYVPTLIFGSLFTSSNYDDQQLKVVGGRNGYGAKLCNIFSKNFEIDTVDSTRKKRFRQTWHSNMQIVDEEIVEDVDGTVQDHTKVTFEPDLARFQQKTLSDDVVATIERRVVDVAATLPVDVVVVLNGQRVEVSGFRDLVEAFVEGAQGDEEVAEDVDESKEILAKHPSRRWHVAATRRLGTMPDVVSFVNNIHTSKGGTHVDYVMNKLVTIIKAEVDVKMEKEVTKKSMVAVKPAMIKSNISLFVNCLVDNPTFESQTKETLTTSSKNFGSSFDFDKQDVIDWSHRSGLIEDIVDQLRNRKTSKAKRKKSTFCDVAKLEDATLAGGLHGDECTLLVTEGDSAKALALAGLEVVGRTHFGVFPLRGKLANASHFDQKKAMQNAEISNLVRILGLRFDEDYGSEEARRSLRYGRLMILADQDEDGSHIKGLIVNFLHRFWPKLVRSDFIVYFRTPLLKARRGSDLLSFYSLTRFRAWQDEKGKDAEKYQIKYYKGLGTSTAKEAREYFSDLDRHVVKFAFADGDDEAIRMAFDRDATATRRKWITERADEVVDEEASTTSYKQFVDDELMKFSLLDLRRSIPSVVDGLKPSQRKVLYAMLKMDDKEMKVSQLAAVVAHSQAYHHGEDSLVSTIVRMAQDFCGASNLPLLQPIGQFGTRHEGGHDAASARYIFTALSPCTRLLFPAADDGLLERIRDDGQLVEPKWLCPILPLVLINGAEGIGTGWATKVLSRDVNKVVDMVKKAVDAGIEPNEEMCRRIEAPYFSGFSGRIETVDIGRFVVHGVARCIRPNRKNGSSFRVEITDLPVGMWTSKYKEKLNTMLRENDILSYHEEHTEKSVKFDVTVDRIRGDKMLKSTNLELCKIFKLNSSLVENLNLFDASGNLRTYLTPGDIAREHFSTRRQVYEQRRDMLLMESDAKLRHADNQIRFVDCVINGQVRIDGRSRKEVESEMNRLEFDSDPIKILKNKNTSDNTSPASDFGYLLEMPMYRLTKEEIERLCEKKRRREREREEILSSNWQQMWTNEIEQFQKKIIYF